MFLRRLSTLFAAIVFVGVVPSAHADLITPTGLNPGDEFRFVFITSIAGPATSTSIADYDQFVTDRATAGNIVIYDGDSVTWQVIGSTATVSALSRLPTSSPALYLINGVKIADSGADLWDGSIDSNLNVNEFGNTQNNSAFTGTLINGLASDRPLGHHTTTKGFAFLTDSSWINGDSQSTGGGSGNWLRFYAFSSVLTVPGAEAAAPEPGSFALLLIGLVGAVGASSARGAAKTRQRGTAKL